MAPDDVRNLPPHRLPRALGGRGADPVFVIESAALGRDLTYRPDPDDPARYGFIEPSRTMTLEAYQAALAATRPAWLLYHP